MFSIEKSSIPDGALLSHYFSEGAYTDCYVTDVSGTVSHSQFVAAFYTTKIFKLERTILKWAVSKPSTDNQAEDLAEGSLDAFSAWHVEDRSVNELLMCDFQGRTRSWLMIVPVVVEGETRTKLYFGSAVVPIKNTQKGKSSIGLSFRILHGFHKIYSKILLYSAKLRLQK